MERKKNSENKTNEVESLLLGGEYEQINVEIPNSTFEARILFLKLVGKERPNAASNLLRIFNTEYLPLETKQLADMLSDSLTGFFTLNLIQMLFDFFTLVLFGRRNLDEVSSFGINPQIVHAPLIFYLDYLYKKRDELNRIKEEVKQKSLAIYPNSPINDKDAGQASVEKLLKWSNLQKDNEAKDLRASLLKWANKFNLSDEWCLDFALNVLKNYKIYIIDSCIYTDISQSDKFITSTFQWNRVTPSEIWARTVQSDTWWDRNPFYKSHPGQPKFQFKWRDDLIEGIWYPQSQPGYFTEQIEKVFWKKVLLAMPSDKTVVGQMRSFSKVLLNLNDQIEKYVKEAKGFYEKLAKSKKKTIKSLFLLKPAKKRLALEISTG